MSSGYPGAIDTLATNKTNATTSLDDHAQHHNDLADAVNHLEAELGINPSGSDPTVAARLDALAGPLTGQSINVKDYAVGDGQTDDTAHFQAAVYDAIDAGLPLVIDPGYSYYIAGNVHVDSSANGGTANFFRWHQPFAGFQGGSVAGYGSKIICGNTAGPCITFGSSTGFRAGHYIDGLKIWAGGNRYRQPMVAFGADQGSLDAGYGHFRVSDLWLDGRNFDTDGARFENALNGGIRGAYTQNMAGGISFTLKAGRTNVGNITFEDCFSGQASIGWLLSEYTPSGAVLMNSYRLVNCKQLGSSDAYMTGISKPSTSPSFANSRFVVQTVTGSPAAGQKVVTLGATTGLAAGQTVTICKADGRLWVDRIASVQAGTSITLTTNLPDFDPNAPVVGLVAGDRVVAGNWHTVCGSGIETVRSVVLDAPHWENCNGFLAQSVRGVEINRPFLGNGVGRGVYAAFAARQVKIDSPTCMAGTPGVTIPDNARMLHQGNDAGNQRNQIRNFCLDDWRTGAGANNAPTAQVMQVDGGQTVAFNERFGGIPAMLGPFHLEGTIPGTATTALLSPNGSTRPIRVPHYGAIVGVQVAVSGARTGGTLTAEVLKGGNPLSPALTCDINGTDTTTNLSEVHDLENTTYTLVPGDQISARVVTTAFTQASTSGVDVTVWVEQ